jgi:hypothetical protein
MRKIYFIISILTISSSFLAQTSNWDFETWTSGIGYDAPSDWENINQYASILGTNPSVEKITNGAPQGFFAAKLTTNACSNCVSLLGPGTDTLSGLIQQSVAYSGPIPQTATFMYQYAGVGSDVGLFYIEVTKWDAVGDSAIVVSAGIDTLVNVGSWTTKNVGFLPGPGITLTPDSIKVTFLSSAGALDIGSSVPEIGSSLSVDALSLNTQVSINEYEGLTFRTIVSEANLGVNIGIGSGVVELIDLTGKVLMSENINGMKTLNVSGFPSGVYLVRCKTNLGIKTNKVFLN